MKRETEIHEEIQRLRSVYHHYILDNIDTISDFDKQQTIRNYAQGISNKFVDILILNELIHKEVK